jgi:hypothetical protein
VSAALSRTSQRAATTVIGESTRSTTVIVTSDER